MKKEAKVLSNVLYIITKIVKVFCFIALACMALCIVITPIFFKNVKMDKNTQTISIKDAEVNYSLKNNRLDIYTADKDILSLSLSNKATAKVYDLLNKDTKYYMLLSEYIFISVLVLFTIITMLLQNVEKLFKNIRDEITPFTEENVFLIQEVAKYFVIYSLVIYLLTLFLEVIARVELNVKVEFGILIYVLGLYLLSFIFDYGVKKEK